MKKLLALTGMLFVSTNVQAANSLEFDFRGDWQNINYNEAAGAPDYSRFYLKTGRFQYKGQVNDRFSYVVRLGFYKPAVDTGTSNAKRDNLNSSVEYAYITDKMSENFSLSMGKFFTELGGFEGATSGADLYMVSPYYGHSAVKTLSGSNLGINQSGPSNLLYMTGIKGILTVAENQNLYLIATNNIGGDPVEGSNLNQNRGMLGAAWRGAFADRTIFGVLSYHEASPQGGTAHGDNKHQFVTAGIKYEADWVASLDYHTTDYKDGATGDKDSVNAAVLKLAYKMDNWTPRLELFTSEEKIKIGTTATNKFTGYGAVLEYKPTAETVRYHIAYNNITAKPEGGADQSRSEIVVGTRLLGDFLK